MEPLTIGLFLTAFLVPADSTELGFTLGGCGIDAGNKYDILCTNGAIYKPYIKRNYWDNRNGWSLYAEVEHMSHLESADKNWNDDVNQTPAMNFAGFGVSYKFNF